VNALAVVSDSGSHITSKIFLSFSLFLMDIAELEELFCAAPIAKRMSWLVGWLVGWLVIIGWL
jgi:hypothetical protein